MMQIIGLGMQGGRADRTEATSDVQPMQPGVHLRWSFARIMIVRRRQRPGRGTGSRSDWRELFAYMDRLCNQLAGSILQGATSNHMIIMPFFWGSRSRPSR
jgi:hypothetical protein